MKNDFLKDTVAASEANAPHRTVASTMLPKINGMANTLAEGHMIVRQKLDSAMKKMNFDSKVVRRFRNYMATSILSTVSNKNDIGHDSSEYYDAKGSIQFCTDGTFNEALSGHYSITLEGISSFSSGTYYMPGYWDVAALPNGMLVILMFSSHPRMLEDSPSGFLPIVVAEHTGDFVALPGGAGYHRRIDNHRSRYKFSI